MKASFLIIVLSMVMPLGMAGCRKRATHDAPIKAVQYRAIKDPIQDAIWNFKVETRQAYNTGNFAALEESAARLRAEKRHFGDGSWAIYQFYEALACRSDEPESMWELHDSLHRQWIDAYPASITARVAYADFMVEYAWHARGSGYANTVSPESWKLFRRRLATARQLLEGDRSLIIDDPVWWLAMMRVALGHGWSVDEYDALVAGAKAFEPRFWHYDTARAMSLLPRWYGQPGDWEDYAARVAAETGGQGDEIYARIVISLFGFYENVFAETRASWPSTRAGLRLMRERYPDSLKLANAACRLAWLADDKELAREMLQVMGDQYVAGAWQDARQYQAMRDWLSANVN